MKLLIVGRDAELDRFHALADSGRHRLAPLAGGGVLTGEVKWNRAPVGARVHARHLDRLHRTVEAGRAWAHEALQPGSPLVYVSASGFEPEFREAVARSGHAATLWALDDLYAEPSATS